MNSVKVFPIMAMLLIVLITGCNKKDDITGVRPMVTSTSPINDDANAEIGSGISVTFTEPMDPSTINNSTFYLVQGTDTIPGTVTYVGTTATFTPTTPLDLDTEYTARLTTGVQDTDGNPISKELVWSFTTLSLGSGPAAVNLRSSANYVILAKTGISNNPTSDITGHIGLSPAATTYVTGFDLTNATGYATSDQITGNIYAADMASPTSSNLTVAVENMITAYNDAAGRKSPHFLELGTGNIGGRTLVPGLYKWTNTVTLPTNVTISGGADDVWIFQIAQNLTVSDGVQVILGGEAQAKNIFWQVAGTATFGTTSQFKGIILSKTGITFQSGASFIGRALAQTAVVLDNNVIVNP